MTRSEARTEDAWRSFDLWATLIVPLLMALPALYLWKTGYGAGATGCCAAPAVAAAPTPVAVPTVAPPVTPPATPAPTVTPPAPVATAPAVDCGAIVTGVSVPFAVNSARLTAAGREALDRTVTCLGTGRYEVAGHTDADGSDADNQRLSEARARSVVRYLVGKGVAESSLNAAGYGETKPVADNTTPEGKARNRRITFTPR